MRFLPLPWMFRNKCYTVCPLTGALLCSDERREPLKVVPKKLSDALRQCQFPYTLKPTNTATVGSIFSQADDKQRRLVTRMLRLRRHGFLAPRIYAAFRRPIFGSSVQASAFFNRFAQDDSRSGNCLSRALFAAKTSVAFPQHGAILIGVFMPSTLMHAWVIENGSHYDPEDRIWTQYHPVGALV